MERPDNIPKGVLPYVEYLETQLKSYKSDVTAARSYLAQKKIIDDITDIMINGILVKDPETEEERRVQVVSGESLSSKDDKIIDRALKFIDNLGKYNSTLKEMEENVNPDLISDDKAESGSILEEVLNNG